MVEHFPEPCAVGGHGPVWCAECMERWPCPDAAPAALKALALPYANHPDYREEWRP